MKKVQNPGCKGCGVCCVTFVEQSSFVDVTTLDIKRLNISSRYVEALPLWDTAMQSMRAGSSYWSAEVIGALKTKSLLVLRGPLKDVAVCACTFLTGSVMHDAHCSRYKTRPETCRKAIQFGDKTCLQLRTFYTALIRDLKESNT